MTIQNGITLIALTPGTNYQIKVSAITEKGQGAEVTTYGRTNITVPNSGMMVYIRTLYRCLQGDRKLGLVTGACNTIVMFHILKI